MSGTLVQLPIAGGDGEADGRRWRHGGSTALQRWGRGDGPMTVDQGTRHVAAPPTESAVADLEELIESTVALRHRLVTHEAVCRRILDEVQHRAAIGCVLPAVRADRWRAAVTDAIKGFEVTRHRVRLDLVGMSLDEGMSIAEIARSWGVSRQLASRWAHEALVAREADEERDDGPCVDPAAPPR